MLRTAVKKVLKAIEANDVAAAETAYKIAEPILDRYANRGLIHRNKASRPTSRVNEQTNALKTAARFGHAGVAACAHAYSQPQKDDSQRLFCFSFYIYQVHSPPVA